MTSSFHCSTKVYSGALGSSIPVTSTLRVLTLNTKVCVKKKYQNLTYFIFNQWFWTHKKNFLQKFYQYNLLFFFFFEGIVWSLLWIWKYKFRLDTYTYIFVLTKSRSYQLKWLFLIPKRYPSLNTSVKIVINEQSR